MVDVTDGWSHLKHALELTMHPGPASGLGALALVASVTVLALLLFRRPIARLLDRAVYLQLFGLRIVARPSGVPPRLPEEPPPAEETPEDRPGTALRGDRHSIG